MSDNTPTPVPGAPRPSLFAVIGRDLYARVFLAYKSTLLGMALLAATEIANQLQAQPSPVLHGIGAALLLACALYKGKAPPAAPLAVLALLFFAAPARAQAPVPMGPPQLGGCLSSKPICFGPSASISVAAINFTKSVVEARFSPGVGYGVTVHRGQWDAFGADVYLALDPVENTASASVIFKFAEYLRIGVSRTFIGAKSWRMPVGVGLDF